MVYETGNLLLVFICFESAGCYTIELHFYLQPIYFG